MTAEATTIAETPVKKELSDIIEKSTSLQQGEKKAFPVPKKIQHRRVDAGATTVTREAK